MPLQAMFPLDITLVCDLSNMCQGRREGARGRDQLPRHLDSWEVNTKQGLLTFEWVWSGKETLCGTH